MRKQDIKFKVNFPNIERVVVNDEEPYAAYLFNTWDDAYEHVKLTAALNYIVAKLVLAEVLS